MKKRGYEISKRLSDIVSSVIALVILSPLLAVIAVLVKVTSPGPVFFRQERIGKSQEPFKLVKFRSMHEDAERTGAQVTVKGDSRITWLGNILRRTKLDELPELWNVLVGEMSIVGPRPEVRRYVEQYRDEWMEVFDVLPGITDLSTSQFRDEESVLEGVTDHEKAYVEVVLPIKMQLSIMYVRKRNLLLDLSIIFNTFGVSPSVISLPSL